MSSLLALTGASAKAQAGAFQSDPRYAAPTPPMPSSRDVAGEAFAHGYAQGCADAHAEAAGTLAAEVEARAALDLSFARLDADMAQALRERLEATVLTLCEATLVAYAHDADALTERVTRAVAMLARAEDERVIRLNPDDLKLVSPRLPAEWTVTPDAALPRGSLRVETHTGGVEDGPAEWRRALGEALAQC